MHETVHVKRRNETENIDEKCVKECGEVKCDHCNVERNNKKSCM